MLDFHVHVFFSPDQRGHAEDIARRLQESTGLSPHSWTNKPAGPFLSPMFQVNVPAGAFSAAIPWLMLHRGSCPVLIHPLTGDDLADHTEHAAWLGDRQILRLDVF